MKDDNDTALVAAVLTLRLADNEHFRKALLRSLSDKIVKALWENWFKESCAQSCFRSEVQEEVICRIVKAVNKASDN